MPTRVKYDLLPSPFTTWLPIEDPAVIDEGTGKYFVLKYETIGANDIAEVADLNDPKSERAYQVRGHLGGFGSPGQAGYQRPLAHVIEGGGAQPTA